MKSNFFLNNTRLILAISLFLYICPSCFLMASTGYKFGKSSNIVTAIEFKKFRYFNLGQGNSIVLSKNRNFDLVSYYTKNGQLSTISTKKHVWAEYSQTINGKFESVIAKIDKTNNLISVRYFSKLMNLETNTFNSRICKVNAVDAINILKGFKENVADSETAWEAYQSSIDKKSCGADVYVATQTLLDFFSIASNSTIKCLGEKEDSNAEKDLRFNVNQAKQLNGLLNAVESLKAGQSDFEFSCKSDPDFKSSVDLSQKPYKIAVNFSNLGKSEAAQALSHEFFHIQVKSPPLGKSTKCAEEVSALVSDNFCFGQTEQMPNQKSTGDLVADRCLAESKVDQTIKNASAGRINLSSLQSLEAKKASQEAERRLAVQSENINNNLPNVLTAQSVSGVREIQVANLAQEPLVTTSGRIVSESLYNSAQAVIAPPGLQQIANSMGAVATNLSNSISKAAELVIPSNRAVASVGGAAQGKVEVMPINKAMVESYCIGQGDCSSDSIAKFNSFKADSISTPVTEKAELVQSSNNPTTINSKITGDTSTGVRDENQNSSLSGVVNNIPQKRSITSVNPGTISSNSNNDNRSGNSRLRAIFAKDEITGAEYKTLTKYYQNSVFLKFLNENGYMIQRGNEAIGSQKPTKIFLDEGEKNGLKRKK